MEGDQCVGEHVHVSVMNLVCINRNYNGKLVGNMYLFSKSPMIVLHTLVSQQLLAQCRKLNVSHTR